MNNEIDRNQILDVQKCAEQVGGRFDLVLIASRRAREIRHDNKESLQHDHTHTVVTALLEIQEGVVGREYLAKRI